MALQVRYGQLDFGILALPSPLAAGLRLTPVNSEPMPLAVSEDHPLAERVDMNWLPLPTRRSPTDP